MANQRKQDDLTIEVADLNEATSDTIVPDGETWEIEEFFGNAAYLDSTVACLVWDPAGAGTILAATHGDINLDMDKKVTGDGVKVLRISLVNDTASPQVLGAGWSGRVV